MTIVLLASGAVTMTGMVKPLLRPWASLTVIGSVFAPAAVAASTAAENENVVPEGWKLCALLPPIALRSPVTLRNVLAGLVPAVTLTVSWIVPPAGTLGGTADPIPVGGVDPFTANPIPPEADRLCASVIVKASVRAPPAASGGIVAEKENRRSPETRSPCVPSSKNVCAALPPIDERSAVTAIPVLAGDVAGVTVTVRSVAFPAGTAAGFAAPTPERTAGAATVSEIVALPVRDCASVMAAAIDFAPVLVATETVAWKEKTLSPAT